jgi:hypothetical protein
VALRIFIVLFFEAKGLKLGGMMTSQKCKMLVLGLQKCVLVYSAFIGVICVRLCVCVNRLACDGF